MFIVDSLVNLETLDGLFVLP